MKKLLSLALLATLALAACEKDDPIEPETDSVITMVSEGDFVSIGLVGSGKATIDWGGGKVI